MAWLSAPPPVYIRAWAPEVSAEVRGKSENRRMRTSVALRKPSAGYLRDDVSVEDAAEDLPLDYGVPVEGAVFDDRGGMGEVGAVAGNGGEVVGAGEVAVVVVRELDGGVVEHGDEGDAEIEAAAVDDEDAEEAQQCHPVSPAQALPRLRRSRLARLRHSNTFEYSKKFRLNRTTGQGLLCERNAGDLVKPRQSVLPEEESRPLGSQNIATFFFRM